MEGHYSTGQSPQWAVVPMEEEEDMSTLFLYVLSFHFSAFSHYYFLSFSPSHSMYNSI